jgi:hypothetical protein
VNIDDYHSPAIDDYRSVLGASRWPRGTLLRAARKTESRIGATTAGENNSCGRAGKISQELSACRHVSLPMLLRVPS